MFINVIVYTLLLYLEPFFKENLELEVMKNVINVISNYVLVFEGELTVGYNYVFREKCSRVNNTVALLSYCSSSTSFLI